MITIGPAKLRPVEENLKLQGRFRHLTADQDVKQIQRTVDWDRLVKIAEGCEE